ncbi:signal recognition particle-docking protein FtsY [Endozoicomonadaceae bacterium StTr2]
MFEKDENKPRRFWPWGRKDEQTAEEAVEQETETNESAAEPEAEKATQRRFWPWGKKEQEQAAVEPEQNQEEIKEESPVVDTSVAPEAAASEQPAPTEQQEVVAQPQSEASETKAEYEAVTDSIQDTTSPEVSEHTEKVAEEKQVAEPVVAEQPQASEPSIEKVVEQAETTEAAPAKTETETVESAEAVPTDKQDAEPEAATPAVAEADQPEEESKISSFFGRMKKGLNKTRNVLVEGVATLMLGKKEIDDELLEDLETQLLTADVGIEATTEIINELTRKVSRNELADAEALITALKQELATILEPANKPLVIPKSDKPYVILVVGVNGVGKTTTIGKLARRLQGEGKKVMLAAGDTFRAAAVEQLQVWGERNQIPVVAQHTGADSASVVYDAFEAAKARQMDVLIADTAGRLHNKDNLMEELKKVKRVLGKIDPEAPNEVLLVLDAGTGQNALNQARLFNEAVQLTGLALTKLDGTAKGGVIFALSKQLQTPIRFLGVGEQIEDLRPFNAEEFVEALFDTSKG